MGRRKGKIAFKGFESRLISLSSLRPGNYHFLLSSLIFDFIIQNGHQTPELFAVNITGVKVLDLDFLNETKYAIFNSPVTILESNGSNRLSKNVTARKLRQEEINQLTSVLLAWSNRVAGRQPPHSNDAARANGAHSSANSPAHRPINGANKSLGHPPNIADISVI